MLGWPQQHFNMLILHTLLRTDNMVIKYSIILNCTISYLRQAIFDYSNKEKATYFSYDEIHEFCIVSQMLFDGK